VSSTNDDKVKLANNSSFSYFSQSVVNKNGFDCGDNDTDQNDLDKNNSVVTSDNLEATMTTKSGQTQSQQGLENEDTLTTKPTTDDDKATRDDKMTTKNDDSDRASNQPKYELWNFKEGETVQTPDGIGIVQKKKQLSNIITVRLQGQPFLKGYKPSELEKCTQQFH
jgi:hypothetical protein